MNVFLQQKDVEFRSQMAGIELIAQRASRSQGAMTSLYVTILFCRSAFI